jgi:dihydrofolate reductase
MPFKDNILPRANVSLIAAVADNQAIGYRNQLIWHISEDLKRFKQLTTGHTIVMGRKTYDSLPKGALPLRTNVVISRSTTAITGCEVYDSLDKALNAHNSESEIFIIGGAQLYAEALPLASKLYITHVNDSPEAADAFFPVIDPARWGITKKEKHNGFSFVEYHLIR